MSAGNTAWARERDAWLRVGEGEAAAYRGESGAYSEYAAQRRQEEHLMELIGCAPSSCADEAKVR